MRLIAKLFTFGCLLFVSGCSDVDPIEVQSFLSTTRAQESMEEGDASSQLEANTLFMKIKKQMVESDSCKYPFFEKDKLVILINGEISTIKTFFEEIVGDNPVIEYRQCSASYQELIDIVDTIKKNKKNRGGRNICMYFIDDVKNKVVVGLLELTPASIKNFKQEICDSDNILFIDAEIERIQQIPPLKLWIPIGIVEPGSYLFNSSNSASYNGSWAFSAVDQQDTTIYGMVTAAHVLPHDSAFVVGYVGQTPLRVLNGDVDAAFVEFEPFDVNTNPNLISNMLATEYVNGIYPNVSNAVGELSTELYSPLVGTIVNKRGWTTGLTTGEVRSTNYNTSYYAPDGSLVDVENMTYASFTSDYGDSGGIVYTYFSSLNRRYTTGIVSYKVSINGNNTGSFYTKAELAIPALGITRR